MEDRETVRDGPQFRPPRPGLRDARSPKPQRRPKFKFPDESSMKPLGGAQSGAQPNAKPGGGERNRTVDLLLAKQALSQLSYTPVSDIRSQVSGIKNPGP